MEYETIHFEEKDDIGFLTLNRPKVNTFTITMFNELIDIFNKMNQSESIKVLIIRGKGYSFSAGGDMEMLSYFNNLSGKELHKALASVLATAEILNNLTIPTIASIHGYCLGVGCSIAMLCDIRIASEDAIFGLEFVGMGILPDTGALYILPRLVGISKAKELAMTNRRIKAQEAEQIGLINRAVPVEQLETEALEIAKQITALPSVAVEMTKKALNVSLNSDLNDILEYEALAQTICLNTIDHKEAVSAFLAKRKPRFIGK